MSSFNGPISAIEIQSEFLEKIKRVGDKLELAIKKPCQGTVDALIEELSIFFEKIVNNTQQLELYENFVSSLKLIPDVASFLILAEMKKRASTSGKAIPTLRKNDYQPSF